MSQAPYFPIDKPTPAWGRLITGDANRIAFEIDARGSGLIGGVSPQILIPHGETVSLLSSAMVQSTMNASANGYEGISHDIQGYVTGPTGAPVRVWHNSPLTSGDPDKWVTDKFSEYRRVTFIDQMPENISPEWIKSTWITKGISGQVRLANFEFRDHYSRRYRTNISDSTWSTFSLQLIDNLNNTGYPRYAHIRYLETIVARVAKGQLMTMETDMDIGSIEAYTSLPERAALSFGIGLKLTRTSDGGADWWIPSPVITGSERYISNHLFAKFDSLVALNAYRQIEIIAAVMPKGATSIVTGPTVSHNGLSLNIQINDSVETGS